MSVTGVVSTAGSAITAAQDIGESIWGALSGGGDRSRDETRSEIANTYEGNWRGLSIACSTQQAVALATALGEVYAKEPSSASQAWSRAQALGYRPGDVGEKKPQGPVETARVVVWLACNGWGGEQSGLNEAEKWARSEIRDQITAKIPEISALEPREVSTVDKLASKLVELGRRFEEAGRAVEGAKKGAKKEVAKERAQETASDAGFNSQLVQGALIGGGLWLAGNLIG